MKETRLSSYATAMAPPDAAIRLSNIADHPYVCKEKPLNQFVEIVSFSIIGRGIEPPAVAWLLSGGVV